jgi:hypothetical protein
VSRSAIAVVFARSRGSGASEPSRRTAACLNLAVKGEAEELRVVADPNEQQRALRILVDGVPGAARRRIRAPGSSGAGEQRAS